MICCWRTMDLLPTHIRRGEFRFAIRNGINFGATTSAISPLQAPDEGLYRFLSKLLTQTCQGSNIYLTDVFSPRSPFLQGAISADNGSVDGAIGPQQGNPLGQ